MRPGFTLIEMVFVIAMVGILMMILVPRMRVSPTRKVRLTAQQLMRDMEVGRTRALATKKGALIVFDVSGSTYTGFLDDNRDGVFGQTVAESRALNARGRVTLPSAIQFGRGSAPSIPADSGAGAITFVGNQVEFSARGVTVPFGTRGVIYLVHRNDPNAVAAVSVSGAGSFETWSFVGGEWR
jgi:prepilin-type N-terminal cleavage/methylation domain-containing protein